MNVLFFVPLCFIASAAGLIIFLAIGIFVAALYSIAAGTRNNNVDGAIGLGFAFAGLILPTVLLVRARFKQKNSVMDHDLFTPRLHGNLASPSMIKSENISRRPSPTAASEKEFCIDEGIRRSHADKSALRFRVRIIDWGFFLYNLMYVPILLLLVMGDAFRTASASGRHAIIFIIAVPSVYTAIQELSGITIANSRLTYPVRIQLYGPFAFPMFRRSIDLEQAMEATAETIYQSTKFSELTRLRLIYISGAFMQAKVWFSSKGRRDWLFSQIRVAAPHVRQYRGRW